MAKTLPQVADSTARPRSVHCATPSCGTLPPKNKSPSTLLTYGKAIEQFANYAAEMGMPTNPESITREHVGEFLIHLQTNGWKPASVANRYRSLQQFFKWLVAEGEISESPMINMKPPTIPDTPPPVLRDDELKALLATCDGTDFDDRRDTAILSLLLDSGIRRAEIAGLGVDDVDFDHKIVVVLGKGRRPRARPVWPQDRARRWTATSASAAATRTARASGSGSGSRAGSTTRASPRW